MNFNELLSHPASARDISKQLDEAVTPRTIRKARQNQQGIRSCPQASQRVADACKGLSGAEILKALDVRHSKSVEALAKARAPKKQAKPTKAVKTD